MGIFLYLYFEILSMAHFYIGLRPYEVGDEEAIAANGNNKRVWQTLTDDFPYPYSIFDAENWIAYNSNLYPHQNLAIIVDGEVVGGVGLIPRTGIFRFSAEVGYWLGEGYWGKGIATEALKQFIPYCFQHFELNRLEARVFDNNPASNRVLEKNGFQFEGIQKHACYKSGTFYDIHLFAFVNDKGRLG